jgi:hypothetical protein
MDRTPLRDFLEIPYDKLEEMNLAAKQQRLSGVPVDRIREERQKYLEDERRINTSGGKLDGACDKPGSTRSAPYSADYVFLRKG